MLNESQIIIELFKAFVEAVLINHDIEKVSEMITDDVMGIGMGTQGIVTCKSEALAVLGSSREIAYEELVTIDYDNINMRCLSDVSITVCCLLKIKTTTPSSTIVSTLGQMMSFRKENDKWLICILQATPIFNEIEEMEAYPIKFADNIVDKYRKQEQIAKNAQSDSLAVYLVDFTANLFEDSVVKNDILIVTENGQEYEKTLFEAAIDRLNIEQRYQFMSAFSLANVLKSYENGITELSLSYQMTLPNTAPTWLKTTIKLYTDRTNEHIKGYLYVNDIDKEYREQIELKNKAERDLMTDLYNKEYAEQKISQSLVNVSPSNPSAFFILDLDYFKNINDTYGHLEGDRIIKEASRFMRSLLKQNDIAGRFGGDEFCIYFHENSTIDSVCANAELLCKNVRSILPAEKNGTSCSIGIVFCDSTNLNFDEIYRRADVSLYAQKDKGRNGYTIYSEDLEK